MNYKEYGEQNSEVMIFLHGGGLSWWNYREEAEKLQKDYHIILPILDGHAGSDKDFTTIESNAADIISFIDEKFGGFVLLIGGLSLGGQILLEILSQRKAICRYAVIESALAVPSKFTSFLIKPVFGSCYGLIRQKWFSKLQFRALRIRPELFDEYFRDTCGITKKNMIAFLQANSLYDIKETLGSNTAKVCILAGEKETRAMKISAERIHRKLPGSSLKTLAELYHGEFSLNHSDSYVKELDEITDRR